MRASRETVILSPSAWDRWRFRIARVPAAAQAHAGGAGRRGIDPDFRCGTKDRPSFRPNIVKAGKID